MTLILGYINDKFAMIAADRRVSTSDGSLIDDGFTKTAVIFGRYIAGFTGLANIGQGEQTMEWFVKMAAKYENCRKGQEGEFISTLNLSKIAEEATSIIQKQNLPKIYKRLAFLIIGYNDQGRKHIIYVTNMHSNTGAVLSEARDEFIFRIERIELNCTFRAVGQNPSKDVRDRFIQQLRSTTGSKLPSARRVSNILAGTIEKSASRTISSTALITTIYLEAKPGTFDVVTPSSKPGQSVDVASPYLLLPGGTIMVMPNQKLRRSKVSNIKRIK